MLEINGRIVSVGDICVDGEVLTGVFIECTKDEIKKPSAKELFFGDVSIKSKNNVIADTITERIYNELDVLSFAVYRKRYSDIFGYDYKTLEDAFKDWKKERFGEND